VKRGGGRLINRFCARRGGKRGSSGAESGPKEEGGSPPLPSSLLRKKKGKGWNRTPTSLEKKSNHFLFLFYTSPERKRGEKGWSPAPQGDKKEEKTLYYSVGRKVCFLAVQRKPSASFFTGGKGGKGEGRAQEKKKKGGPYLFPPLRKKKMVSLRAMYDRKRGVPLSLDVVRGRKQSMTITQDGKKEGGGFCAREGFGPR